jgi:hypothetical protein
VLGMAFLAATTPMVFFLAGAVNPNALEIASGASLLALLLSVLHGSRATPSWPVLIGIVVSGVLLANTRGLSPLWMGLIGVLALLAAPRGRVLEVLRSWRVIAALAALALGVAAACAWILSTNTLGSMGVYPGAEGVTPVGAFLVMLIDRSFDPGIIGVFGWLDTFAPGFVLVLWSALLFGLLVAAFTAVRGRALLSLVAATAVVTLVPPVAQAASIETSGYIWQGRYTLVAFVVLMLLTGLQLGASLPFAPLARRLLVSLSVLVVLGHTWSLALATKRYAVGIDRSWAEFLLYPRWLPPAGHLWTVTCLLGAVAFVAVVIAAHGHSGPQTTEPGALPGAATAVPGTATAVPGAARAVPAGDHAVVPAPNHDGGPDGAANRRVRA